MKQLLKWCTMSLSVLWVWVASFLALERFIKGWLLIPSVFAVVLIVVLGISFMDEKPTRGLKDEKSDLNG